jgi:hypothetical protein
MKLTKKQTIQRFTRMSQPAFSAVWHVCRAAGSGIVSS